MDKKLTKELSVNEFETHYWYAADLKKFAKEIGISHSLKLRKDELERLFKHFLQTGEIQKPKRKNIKKSGKKDVEIGLTPSLPVRNYTSNRETKDFIISEAQKTDPDFNIKSGVWYRINRWRDEQITKSNPITYGNLIDHFVALNQTEKKFEKIPSTLFNNFISDYLKNEPKATRKEALKEWDILKTLEIKKDYISWKKHKEKHR